MIQLNSKGELVIIAKYLLNYSDTTDDFDKAFEEYVKKWQKANKLEVDGIIGNKSWKKMAACAPTCSTSKNNKGNYVYAIQLLIGGIEVTGNFDTKTKNAVAAYQAAVGLSADGICGPKTWAALLSGKKANETDTNKVLNSCVKYLQWDKKWKNVKYSTHTSKQTIGNSGCGTTSMAMILATWYDKKITPVETSKLAVDNGYRTYDSGTAWGFYKFCFKKYGCFEKYVETNSVTTLMAALREGALAVCSMNGNDNHFFTTSGHFVVARGCDDKYIYYNDPNKEETPRKHLATKSQKCLKQAFIFWPLTEKKTVKEEKKEEKPSTNLNLDGKIIDISKYQGTIDFKKLQPNVSLIIARASSRTNKDVKLDEYAKEMKKYNIPFGVYCYSYADTTAKAIEEATLFYQYAKDYDPLFYVLDAEEERLTTSTIKAFVQELRKHTEKPIGCYVAHNRYNAYKYDTIKSLFNFTWIPRYGKNNGTISGSTKPSYQCDLWQYTSTAKIAGISGNVDMNVITGDGHDLKWFLNI